MSSAESEPILNTQNKEQSLSFEERLPKEWDKEKLWEDLRKAHYGPLLVYYQTHSGLEDPENRVAQSFLLFYKRALIVYGELEGNPIENVANYLFTTVKNVDEARRRRAPTKREFNFTSIEELSGNNVPIEEYLTDWDTVRPTEDAALENIEAEEIEEEIKKIKEIIEGLKEIDQNLLIKFYGLGNVPEMEARQIADELNENGHTNNNDIPYDDHAIFARKRRALEKIRKKVLQNGSPQPQSINNDNHT